MQEITSTEGFRRAFAPMVLGTALMALAFIRFHADTGTAVDRWILGWIVAHRHPGLTTLATGVTSAGSPPVIAGLTIMIGLALWWQSANVLAPVVLIATVGLAGAASTAMKVLVGAHRPPAALHLLPESDYAFPSGHVTATLTLLGLAATIPLFTSTWAKRGLAAAVALGVLLIAATRLYLGVHWFTDVVGGVLLGGLVSMFGHNIFLVLDRRAARGRRPLYQLGVIAPR